MELVIRRSGRKATHISPPRGVVWTWAFVEGGRKVSLQYGFPHGESRGAFALHDVESGRELARFSSKPETAPDWVKPLLASSR